MYSHRLSDAEIQHDLLATTWNSVGSHISIKPLNLQKISIWVELYVIRNLAYLCSLPTTAVTQPTEDLASLTSTKLKGHGRLGFQAGNGSTKLKHRFSLVHHLALIDDILEPIVGGLYLASHVRELQADDRVVDESLAKCLSLVGVFDRFLVAYP